MRFFRTKTYDRAGGFPRSGLALLLLGVVLVPSICLLWFMQQAMENERLAVRQKLVEAYRTPLVLAQEKLQIYWRRLAETLETPADRGSAPALFARLIRGGECDSVVYFEPDGRVLYPSDAIPAVAENSASVLAEARSLETNDPAAAALAYAQLAEKITDAGLLARVMQAQARCLLRSGDQARARAVLTALVADERYRKATDSAGRLIQPSAELLLCELLKTSSPEPARSISARLRARLLDYDHPEMASAQRRFLMRELQKLFPENNTFPTLAAEDLAGQWIATGKISTRDPTLRPSSIASIWQFASPGGRVVILHRHENLLARLRKVIAQPDLPPDVLVDLVAPGGELEGSLLALPIGSSMPEWRLVLRLQDQRLFDATTNRRVGWYLWIVVLVVVTVIVLALLAWDLIRRQMALTQLRNDLVANVTHELKTPLASMRLFVETLLDAPQLHEPTVRDYLRLIAKENLRLSRLIDNFLTFSRIERNKYVFTLRETSATAIAENAVAAVRDRFQPPDCRFDVDIAAALPRVTADADAVVTALVNLLDNAWKYSGEAKQIAFTAEQRNGTVVFTVRDNGIGLSPRETRRIFQRFYQVNQHLSPTGGGCGLGLSIVQSIARAHHGAVRVDSRMGEGSTFTFILPVAGSHGSEKP